MEADQKYYDETMNSKDPMVVTIKGALIIEYWINTIIEDLVISKPAFNRAKFDFGHKLNLLISFGYPERFYKPILKFSQIRNKYAHNLHYQLDRKIVIEFYNLLSKFDQKVLVNTYQVITKGTLLNQDPLRLDPLSILKLCFATLRAALILSRKQSLKAQLI